MKISHTIINRIIELACSKTEINFIIYIAQFQMKNGFIPNIYYRDVIDYLHINPTTFYRILHKLKCKNFLTYEISDRYGFYNITLLDNDFSKNNFEDGYVNINRAFLFSEDFKTMRASEKYVLLKLLMRNVSGKDIALSNDSVADYANIDRNNRKVISRIVNSLKEFKYNGSSIFNLFIKRNNKQNRNINCFKFLNTYKQTVSETKSVQVHMFKNFCRKHRIEYTDKDIDDLVQMDNQYRFINQVYKKHVKEILLQYHSVETALIRSIVDPISKRLASIMLDVGEWYSLV